MNHRFVLAVALLLLSLISVDAANPDPAFHEKPLSSYVNERDEAYRIEVWPTFEQPYLLRIVRKGNQWTLTQKQLSGVGGYYPGILFSEKSQTLSTKEAERIRSLFNQSHFFTLASKIKEPVVLDATSYLIEATAQGKTHFITRTFYSDKKEEDLISFVTKFESYYRPQATLIYFNPKVGDDSIVDKNGIPILIGK